MEQQLPYRKQLRLQGYDYTRPAYYFCTIAVNDKLHLFGYIDKGEMHLSAAGKIILQTINEISSRFDKTEITEYIVMPNHVHLVFFNGGKHYVPDIICWVKSVSTNRYIHGVNEQGWPRFNKTLWQRNYYEHIIRSQESYINIINYIKENPSRWAIHDEDEDICGLPKYLTETVNSNTGVHGGTPLPTQQ